MKNKIKLIEHEKKHPQTFQVNLQEPNDDGLASIQWDFENSKNWQTLLNDDSMVDFVNRSETPDELHNARINFCARYLDMPISWVHPFSVTNAGWQNIGPKKETIWFLIQTFFLLEYDERYPNGCKKIYYKRIVLEWFSPYLNDDGVVKRLTMYKNLNYTEKVCCWQWYRNRDDSLETIEKNFQTNQIVENYASGRCDSLKCNNKSCEYVRFHEAKSKVSFRAFDFDDVVLIASLYL